jgi:hypothetical protein
MNAEALLIFGKIMAWIFLALFSLIFMSSVFVVIEHNNDRFKVATQGRITFYFGRMLFFLFMIVLSIGFLVGTCGV